ncbi:MAG: group II intron reverse transcriptase/maturase [Oryzomonas sp.]|uniref:group II intron reverse transcriptase/maturase n=1 Tax=Oryzomonas sp. TaxID=2855186 RepID=UPI00284F05E7|nr:group II intron reverse transcriptase/maturase [Oryzomonas sp.]MDR3578598.1 group II intron reverse transcriptase/maturase [Oryzomonas sp.]
MTTGAAEGLAEMPGASPEGSGRRPRVAGTGAANVTGRKATHWPEAATQLMEKIVSRGNMMAAYSRVISNKGAPGVDGMPVTTLMDYLRQEWPRIREELLAGTYHPQPVRKVEIPKPGGGTRMLGIPTVLDRLIQQAVQQVINPLFDPGFSESSYGFRPKRSAHQAVKAAQKHVANGLRWVVDIDLEKFFDRVHHDTLMSLVKRKVGDRQVLSLIDSYLKAGILEGGVTSPRVEGTPQGGPLSPLLSNILLDELDEELEKRGHAFCRYADDCNIYVATRTSGERVMASITGYLSERLKLTVNQAKSAVDRPWKRSFLSYSMTWHRKPRLTVATKAVDRLKANLKTIFRRGRGKKLQTTIEETTPKLRGWVNYFRHAEVKGVFEELDGWLRRKLRRILWKQWKHPFTRAKNLTRLGLSEATAWRSATNGHGPWWNAGAAHMNKAVPKSYFDKLGLVSFIDQHHRLQHTS